MPVRSADSSTPPGPPLAAPTWASSSARVPAPPTRVFPKASSPPSPSDRRAGAGRSSRASRSTTSLASASTPRSPSSSRSATRSRSSASSEPLGRTCSPTAPHPSGARRRRRCSGRRGRAHPHRGEVDRHVESDVDVVGEDVERDVRDRLDDLLVAPAVRADLLDLFGRDRAPTVDEGEGEPQQRSDALVRGLAHLGGRELLGGKARLAPERGVRGEAVVARIPVRDGDGDLLAERRAEGSRAKRTERAP